MLVSAEGRKTRGEPSTWRNVKERRKPEDPETRATKRATEREREGAERPLKGTRGTTKGLEGSRPRSCTTKGLAEPREGKLGGG